MLFECSDNDFLCFELLQFDFFYFEFDLSKLLFNLDLFNKHELLSDLSFNYSEYFFCLTDRFDNFEQFKSKLAV